MKTALLITDPQNDFCDDYPTASLPVTGGGDIIRAINTFLRRGRPNYDLIIVSQDWHEQPGGHFSDTPDYVDTWPAHCVAGSDGAALHTDLLTGLEPDAVNVWVRKGQRAAAYSMFDGTVTRSNIPATVGADLHTALATAGITHVDVVGLAESHCVAATAISAADAGYVTTIIGDLTVGVSADTTAAARADVAAHNVTYITSTNRRSR
jgi:nicotinamidase/pyrazinamidase